MRAKTVRDSAMNRAAIALLLTVSVPTSATGAAPASPLDAVLACRRLDDAATRLACFDRASDLLAAATTAAVGMAASPATPPATASPPVGAPPPVLAPAPDAVERAAAETPNRVAPVRPLDSQQAFGMPPRDVAAAEVAAGVRAPAVDKIRAAIAAVGRTADGRLLFTLDNGQVWRQLLVEGELLAVVGESVTISRGLFGSFWLQAASGRGCKVNRVQ
jgi:hypothetical protein